MACQGCEARRIWIKQQAEIASERLKQLLQRLNAGATQTKQQLIQQNQRLIEQHEAKDEIILQSLQQNNELIAQMYEQEDEPEGSQYLDG